MITLLVAAALMAPAPVKKETQGDRIEKRLIRIESLLESSTRREAARHNAIQTFNRCHKNCPPWQADEDETERKIINACHDACKLPDYILGE